MKIVRTTTYQRSLRKLGATAAEIAALESAIIANPAAGVVIPGLGGVRKIRFPLGGKGKSGGGRAIYIVLWVDATVFMIMAYKKSVQEDLSQDQREMVLKLIEELKR